MRRNTNLHGIIATDRIADNERLSAMRDRMAMSFHEGNRTNRRKRLRLAGWCISVLGLLTGVFAATPVRVEPERPVVDLELILAVDVSSSMSEAEQRVQRDGYVSAFRHPGVARAIGLGPRGMIAVAYIEWAGPSYQRIVLPWTIIASSDEAKRFADALAVQPIAGEAGTSISGGLLQAEDLFTHSRSKGQRRVIDVSGDGPNNAGPSVTPVRDKLVASGISINGLPISLHSRNSSAFESFSKNYLESYFERCVIGGPDAFTIGIDDISQFEVAVRRKLVREIAGLPARAWLASYQPRSSSVVDCLAIGQVPGR